MIQVFSDKPSPRLTFAADAVFNRIGGFEVSILTNREDLDPDSFIINYSTLDVPSHLQIVPHGLLHETGIREVHTSWNTHEPIPQLLLDGKPFDVLAAAFYLLSRYEEYDYFEPDHHQRFPASESCLFEGNVLERPVVDEWIHNLLDSHEEKLSLRDSKKRTFQVTSTIDIDQAWKYKHKSLWIHLGRSFSDFLKLSWAAIQRRWSVLLGFNDDPWFTYEFIKSTSSKLQLNVKCFLQVGGRGEFDKNTSIQNVAFQNLIKEINQFAEIGIHPSYLSNNNPQLVEKEKQDLERVLGKEVSLSRQHYLMHQMPSTYQNLVKLGIKEEHTLGYSTHLGFRAGTSVPFLFYDIQNERMTDMVLVPFCFMDITPQHYLQWSQSESIEKIKVLVDKVHQVKGHFVSLWHNESLSDQDQWENWRQVYEQVHSYACQLENKAST